MNLRRIAWLFRKEMNIYLTTPLAYFIGAVFVLVSGYMFYVLVSYFAQTYNRYAMMGSPEGMDLTQMILRPFLSNTAFLFLLIIPLTCMRLFAEERRQGTIELLMTSPLTTLEVVFGKFFAAVAMNFLIYLLTLLFPVFLLLYGNPDMGPVVSGYLGVLLLIMAFSALALFASAVTSSQIVAAVIGLGLLLMTWIIGWISFSEFGTSTWLSVLQYISVPNHLEDFFKGVIDTKHVIYFLSVTFLGLFTTYGAVESMRWRSGS